jgi:UDP-N-acetylmuramoylalanine--D-glutamate ligase
MICPVDALKIKGRHNWFNALAACALATCANISREAMIEALTTFQGLPHRCQWIRECDDVVFINDSKGTNVGATLSAIAGIGGSIRGKIVLIAGGQGKSADFTSLKNAVKTFVRSIVLIGQDADKLESVLQPYAPTLRAQSLDEAVLIARQEAKPGDVVLLSPACASLDMFRDFNHRGEVFTSAVVAL